MTTEAFKAGYAAGLERAAVYLEGTFGASGHAIALRTIAAGGEPCEDCGYALPAHDETCVQARMAQIKARDALP